MFWLAAEERHIWYRCFGSMFMFGERKYWPLDQPQRRGTPKYIENTSFHLFLLLSPSALSLSKSTCQLSPAERPSSFTWRDKNPKEKPHAKIFSKSILNYLMVKIHSLVIDTEVETLANGARISLWESNLWLEFSCLLFVRFTVRPDQSLWADNI